jgi:catechol 2,3-dioxygenase-like lactoylglutathione lyase family enzyme
MSIVQSMDHFTVLTTDVEKTKAFYGLFGLTPGPRPKLSFPGVWLYAADRPILHVVEGRPIPAEPSGILDHMAFRARGLAETVGKLRDLKVEFSLRQVGDEVYRGWQLFCHDPFGAKVEFDFDYDEAPPADWKPATA